jgi:hypothetical protein
MKVGLSKSVLLNFLLLSCTYLVRFELGFLTIPVLSLGEANAAPVPDSMLESSADPAIAADPLANVETLADVETTVISAEGVAEDDPELPAQIAAAPVSVPVWGTPVLSPTSSQPAYRTEDELIAQMTGAAPVEAVPSSTASPGLVPFSPAAPFQPSSAPTAPDSAPTSAATAAPRATPREATTVATTDVGARLFTPDQSSNTAAISAFEAQQIHQVIPSVVSNGTTVSNGATVANSAPGSTAAPVVSQAAQLTPDSLTSQAGRDSFLRSTALTPPSITLQGVYIFQDDESSARARLRALYPITPNLQAGATLDLTTGNALSDSPDEGLSINELYLAASLPDVPSLRFVVGQLDLTSYFDRNSFAKDGASQFFNPVFQTNPALTATGIGSRPAALINWSLTDNLEARAAVFSSSRAIGDFDLDGFAGEVAFWMGNAIIRGTYATGRDAGNGDGFGEIFDVDRGNGEFGLRDSDREESYGVNAEIFVPALNMGIFARYGRYENRDLDASGDTYSGGVTFLDLFMPSDRLGLAYGRGLSNESLRSRSDRDLPDVAELFYDFSVLPNLRLGFTLQQLDGFSETIAGFRIRTEFDVTPRGSL